MLGGKLLRYTSIDKERRSFVCVFDESSLKNNVYRTISLILNIKNHLKSRQKRLDHNYSLIIQKLDHLKSYLQKVRILNDQITDPYFNVEVTRLKIFCFSWFDAYVNLY